MSTKYEYIKTPVDLGRLSSEILDEPEIPTILLYCNFNAPNNLEIYFDSDISKYEKTLLDGIVANHSGDPLIEPAFLPTGDLPIDMVPISDGTGETSWINTLGLVYNVLGSNEYETSVEDESTTTSIIWQRKLRFELIGLLAGKYKVKWYYEWAYDEYKEQFKSQLQIDETNVCMEQEVSPASSDSYSNSSGFVYVNLTAGDHVIDLDYCSSKNGKIASIRRARVSVSRIS